MSADEKRIALHKRINAAQRRVESSLAGDYARDTADVAIKFAKRHPLALIASGALLGIALGGLTRRGRKAATATGLLGRFATDAAVAFALAMYERASDRLNQAPDNDEVARELTDRTE